MVNASGIWICKLDNLRHTLWTLKHHTSETKKPLLPVFPIAEVMFIGIPSGARNSNLPHENRTGYNKLVNLPYPQNACSAFPSSFTFSLETLTRDLDGICWDIGWWMVPHGATLCYICYTPSISQLCQPEFMIIGLTITGALVSVRRRALPRPWVAIDGFWVPVAAAKIIIWIHVIQWYNTLQLCTITSARVKSYQLVKVVSGGRACGKSLILASTQLLVIEWSHCFGAVRLEKVWFLFQGPYTGCCCLVAAAWLLLLACLPACLLACLLLVCCLLGACCLLAACLLLAPCCLPAACLRLACGLPAACLRLACALPAALPAAAATADHCWILVQTFYPARKQQSILYRKKTSCAMVFSFKDYMIVCAKLALYQ